jgi:mannose-6-phosphate isomerase-like protein (cupin superfamily)
MTVRTTTADLETVTIPGNTFHIIEDGTATGGRIGVVECELAPGWPGPPQHVHHEHDETFYVLTGAVRFASGTNSFVATAGESVIVPREDPHTFSNADPEAPARLLGTVAPARFIDYFRELADMEPDAEGRLDPGALGALMKEYATAPHVVGASQP